MDVQSVAQRVHFRSAIDARVALRQQLRSTLRPHAQHAVAADRSGPHSRTAACSSNRNAGTGDTTANSPRADHARAYSCTGTDTGTDYANTGATADAE
jgi:hypothetical protein